MVRLTTVLFLTTLFYIAGVACSQNTPGSAASGQQPAGGIALPAFTAVEADAEQPAASAATPAASTTSAAASSTEAEPAETQDTPAAAEVPDPVDLPASVETAAPAAEESAVPATATDSMREQVRKLSAELTALKAEVAKLKTAEIELREELAAHQKAIASGTESVAKLIPLVDRNLTSIEDLRERAVAAETRLDDHRTRILAAGRLANENDLKLRAIAVPDGSGSYMVDLSSKMELSPTFKRQVQRTLQGKLRIYNQTDYSRTLYINGTAWSARPGWSYIWVPVGPVIVHRTADSEAEVSDEWEQISNSATPEWVLRYKF